MKISLWGTSSIVFLFCLAAAIASPAQTFTTLYNFSGPDGGSIYAGLTQGTDGNFYGTTGAGGANYDGEVFKITPDGTMTTLYSFCPQANCPDGFSPWAGLIQATDGNFYGTARYGGVAGDWGTVFKITPNGTLTTLHSFDDMDGSSPQAGLLQAADGNFYGTTAGGGANEEGTIFKITAAGKLTTLYTFATTDGANPQAGLIHATDGNFYGTTYRGGANGYGTVFKMTASGTLTVLYSFAGTDGAYPQAALLQAIDGNFYGTTAGGGVAGYGTVFKMTASGTLTTLHSFAGSDGQWSFGSLVQGSDGNFYGTTYQGGSSGNCSNGCGTIFKITASGTLTTLHSFDGTDGSYVYAGLVQGSNGNFYGTTYSGGPYANGTVFSISGPSPAGLQFVPVTPCRLLDTRPQYGGSGPIPGGTIAILDVQSLAQQTGCGDLSSAAAYSLNPAVVPHGPLGYLTMWPAGRSLPLASTLDSLDGRVKANAAIVIGGVKGAISVFASNTTDLVLDINGYFAAPSSSTLAFYTLPPCRVADTRYDTYPQGLGWPHLSGGVARDFPILSAAGCNIPSTAQAYSLNFAAVPHPALGWPLGYLELWATDNKPQNLVSTLNNPTGTIVANAAIVASGTAGNITALASNDTDLVIDIDGYFAPADGKNALSLYPAGPCRVVDTRKGNGAFAGVLTVDVLDSGCAPPNTAQAYVLSATVVPWGPLGYLTLWPDGTPQPTVATLNALDGAVTSNMAIVPTNNGKIDSFASNLTQLILDISSYFAP